MYCTHSFYKMLVGVLTLRLALVMAFVGPASAASRKAAPPSYETETFLKKYNDWDRACARVEATDNKAPKGSVKFKLKDRTTGDSESVKVKLQDKGDNARACWNDLGDSLEDGHRYKLRALYSGYESNTVEYDPSSDSRTFKYVE